MRSLRDLVKAGAWSTCELVLTPAVKLWLLVLNAAPIRLLRTVARHSWWKAQLGGLGERTRIRPKVVIHSPGKVHIGSDCSVAEFVHIWGGGGVRIGNDVLIAAGTAITSESHDPRAAPYRASHIASMVNIADNVWIGSGVTILPGVSVGRDAIVGAGSVVREDVPTGAVVGGIPARILRVRDSTSSHKMAARLANQYHAEHS